MWATGLLGRVSFKGSLTTYLWMGHIWVLAHWSLPFTHFLGHLPLFGGSSQDLDTWVDNHGDRFHSLQKIGCCVGPPSMIMAIFTWLKEMRVIRSSLSHPQIAPEKWWFMSFRGGPIFGDMWSLGRKTSSWEPHSRSTGKGGWLLRCVSRSTYLGSSQLVKYR